MKELLKNIMTMFKAARYSIAFCWRSDNKLMLKRITLSAIMSLLNYVSVYSFGLLVNTIQGASTSYTPTNLYAEFMASGLLLPIILTLGSYLANSIAGSYHGLLRGESNEVLRFANYREMHEHRATLDVATIRSKEFDDLERRIGELPSGWGTRINFSQDLLMLFNMVVTFVTFGTTLLWYNGYYALIILIASVPMMLVEFKVANLWWNVSEKLVPEFKKRDVLEKPYRGGVTAFIQAQMFGQLPTLRKEIDLNVDNVINTHSKIRRSAVVIRLVGKVLTIMSLVGVTLHAGWMVVSHTFLSIGTLTIILNASRSFQSSIESVASLIADQWNNAKGLVLIEESFFTITSKIVTEYPVVPPADITPEIVFDHVSFRYPDTERLVLDDVSFTVKPGSRVAIVGTSGHGKSTLLSLLMRYYDPTSGNIFASGINLKNIKPKDWYTVISALTQEYIVLDRTIGDEIASSRLGEPVNISAVESAAMFANFDTVVHDDPKGLNAQLGVEHGGRELSGGEKQRLALARVRYRGTPVLVLDEPDAKLDANSAEIVMNNILALTGVTVVIITHHISRAEMCDKIIVMEKGKVVEKGTHDELMTLGGSYVSMREKDRERLSHRGVPS